MKKLNLKIWLAILALGMLVACSTENTSAVNEASHDRSYKKTDYSDAEWVEKITGTWFSAEVSKTAIEYYEKTYFADMSSCGFFHDATINYHDHVGLFKGTWEISDGILTAVVTEATSSSFLEPDDVFTDRIISVIDGVMILQDIETGKVYRRYRLKQPRHRANCKLWENFDLDEDEVDEDAKVKTWFSQDGQNKQQLTNHLRTTTWM